MTLIIVSDDCSSLTNLQFWCRLDHYACYIRFSWAAVWQFPCYLLTIFSVYLACVYIHVRVPDKVVAVFSLIGCLPRPLNSVLGEASLGPPMHTKLDPLGRDIRLKQECPSLSIPTSFLILCLYSLRIHSISTQVFKALSISSCDCV